MFATSAPNKRFLRVCVGALAGITGITIGAGCEEDGVDRCERAIDNTIEVMESASGEGSERANQELGALKKNKSEAIESCRAELEVEGEKLAQALDCIAAADSLSAIEECDPDRSSGHSEEGPSTEGAVKSAEPPPAWTGDVIADRNGMFFQVRSESGETYDIAADELDAGCQYASPKQGDRYTIMSTATVQGTGGGMISLHGRLEDLPTRAAVIERFRSAPFDCGGRPSSEEWIASMTLLPAGDDQWSSLMKPAGTLEIRAVEIDEVEGDCDAVVTGAFSCTLAGGAREVRVTGAFRTRFGIPE